jgi:predicted AlkP superfamily phosphohydrolase/phosphomutase/Flp pilus assembly protein TadD
MRERSELLIPNPQFFIRARLAALLHTPAVAMPRSRTLRILVFLAGIVVILYLLVSLFLPSSRRMVVGVDRDSGTVRVVRSSVTFLPPHRFSRFSFEKRNGYAQRDGFIRISSLDKVPVTINYRLRFNITGDHLRDARRVVDQGWDSWIGARVAEAVDAVTRQVPIEDLLSPNSRFNAERDPLRRIVTNHLAQSGLNVTGFEVARFEVDREALLAVKRTELRRDARGVAGRVAIFAIDGADWELISELADDGRIPNIKALVHNGTSASVQTIQPTVSPILWTTVATGLSPDRHGVLDFTDHARNVPVDSRTRRVPALWEISDAFGRPAQVVNWWTDWPASASAGAVFDTPGDLVPTAVSPASAAARAQSNVVPVETVGFRQVARFMNITQAEYDTAVNSKDASNPINVMRGILAKTWTDHRVALSMYNERKPVLFMMSFDGTDAVNHLFSPYHPPYREDVSSESYRKYWPTVANYYSEVDRLIGEWMQTLPEDTTVILMSAHGFRWGKTRPMTPPAGAALSYHRSPGMLIAYGNHIVPSRTAHTISIFDIAPTVLAILGLPQSMDMPGKFPDWMLRDVTPVKSVRVVSYSEFVTQFSGPVKSDLDPNRFAAQLRTIGHLNDPSRNLKPVLDDEEDPVKPTEMSQQQWGSYAYYNDLGVQLRGQSKLKDAAEAFGKAAELNPSRPVPFLNLAMVQFDRAQYPAADEAMLAAITKGLPNGDRALVDYAALYRDKNMISRGIYVLYKAKQLYPQSYQVAANLGAFLAQAERFTEGQAELERALGLQPASTLALNNLGIFYLKKSDYARALDFWNRSLTIDPAQPQIRDAANALRTRL